MPLELSASQALGLWHSVSMQQVRLDERDLSLRQLAILLEIYLVPPPHTVRGLAAKLDVMGALGLVTRERDERDRRNVIIKRTIDGALYLERLGDLIIGRGRSLTQ